MPEIIEIAGRKITRGERVRVDLKVPSLFDSAEMSIPLEVLRGKKDGPVLFISAAIHGDEVNGVEAIHQVLHSSLLKNLQGTLIAAPIVNIYGFNNKSRYLPDRRDLNRCFPGSSKGSLGARLAEIIMREVITHCTHVIDLHTAAIHRTNLPQIRASFDGEKAQEIQELAESFGAPVMVKSNLRDGSFREAVRSEGVPILLFEGGEALRFEPRIIRTITKGIFNVMRKMEMLKGKGKTPLKGLYAQKTAWVRASKSGIFKMDKKLGDVIKKGDIIARITNPYGTMVEPVTSPYDGVVIGMNLVPLVMAGEALCNIGLFDDIEVLEEVLEHHEI